LIITCSECGTKYRYEEARFGGAEVKKVKCTSCGHSFDVHNPLDEPSSATSIGKMFSERRSFRSSPHCRPNSATRWR